VAVLRRDLAVPAAVVACAGVYVVSERSQSPYVTAKALVIAAPLAAVLVYRGLLPVAGFGGRRWPAVPAIALAVAFAAGAAWSSQMAMRWSPVESIEQRTALEALRDDLGDRPTLFLGSDDYFAYRLRGVPVGDITPEGPGGPIPAAARTEKPVVYAQTFDFDSVDAATLDGYDAVVLPRTPFASEPPANFRLLARTSLYEAWERVGPTPPRAIIEGSGAPGAVLDCEDDPEQRRLSRQDGEALVWPLPFTAGNVAGLSTGGTAGTELRLPEGRWELSVSYISTIPVRVLIGTRRWELPANTNRPGPYFRFGEVRSDGRRPLIVGFISERVSRATSRHSATFVGAVAATRADRPRRTVPLRRACGRFVDWYRTSPTP